MGRVSGKVAVITGAGAGIGKTSALLLANEGAKVVVTDINEVNGQQTVDEIASIGGEALYIKHDVTQEDQWREVVRQSVESFRQIDILFNNAGVYLIKRLIDTTLEEWNQVMNVNVTGVFLGMKHVIPVMSAQKSGSIINISSVAGLQGYRNHTLYGASKGAVRIMTKDAAMEYGSYQIRVNSIHPGIINTDMAQYALEKARTTAEEFGAKVYPLGRIGQPADVANMVLFLASDESSFVTGAEFAVDGGTTAGRS